MATFELINEEPLIIAPIVTGGHLTVRAYDTRTSSHLYLSSTDILYNLVEGTGIITVMVRVNDQNNQQMDVYEMGSSAAWSRGTDYSYKTLTIPATNGFEVPLYLYINAQNSGKRPKAQTIIIKRTVP